MAQSRAQVVAVTHIDHDQDAPAGIALCQLGHLLNHMLPVFIPFLLDLPAGQTGNQVIQFKQLPQLV